MTYNTQYYILPSSIRRTFVESASFSRKIDEEDPEVLLHIQTELLKNLSAGAVIQGTGGFRKVRIADASRGKGKRGGYRVIYLDVPGLARTYLFMLYDKREKEDLSPDEKRILKGAAEKIKKGVR